MLKNAIDAELSIIGVTTDDLFNASAILTEIAGINFYPAKSLQRVLKLNEQYCWCIGSDVTLDNAKDLAKENRMVVIFNPPPDNPFIFYAGELPTPKKMLVNLLAKYIDKSALKATEEALKGLSLTSVEQILKLTKARVGNYDVKELRRTKAMLGITSKGLTPIDTYFEFYKFPSKLKDWLDNNKKYFLSDKTPFKLRPRGVLLEGSPGVGKSMAAKAIAQELDVPLYKLDIAASLNKYVGESESEIARSLQLVAKSSPCVLLLDEVEKIFTQQDGDNGVTTRIMSQLLWWLAEHQDKVLTIMTTNNMSVIPPELYRAGRVDMVMKIPKLSMSEAQAFGMRVFEAVVGKPPAANQQIIIKEALRNTGYDEFAHAEVSELIYTQIKIKGWVKV